MSTLETIDLIEKILVAAMLGGMVGLEREWSGRPAGVRTNLLIALGSCLFTILSIHGFQSGTAGMAFDPSRIAAQIVTGVGFLGAGALIRNGGHVHRLTTAADIWVVSAIGMAVGTGMIAVAVFVTILSVTALYFLLPVSRWLEESGEQSLHERERQPELSKPTAPTGRIRSMKKLS